MILDYAHTKPQCIYILWCATNQIMVECIEEFSHCHPIMHTGADYHCEQ